MTSKESIIFVIFSIIIVMNFVTILCRCCARFSFIMKGFSKLLFLCHCCVCGAPRTPSRIRCEQRKGLWFCSTTLQLTTVLSHQKWLLLLWLSKLLQLSLKRLLLLFINIRETLIFQRKNKHGATNLIYLCFSALMAFRQKMIQFPSNFCKKTCNLYAVLWSCRSISTLGKDL